MITWFSIKINPYAEIFSPLWITCAVKSAELFSNFAGEKYLKTMEFLKTVNCIGISVKNYPEVFGFIQIGQLILVENACWSSAFWKIRNHRLSFHKFLYILNWIFLWWILCFCWNGSLLINNPSSSLTIPPTKRFISQKPAWFLYFLCLSWDHCRRHFAVIESTFAAQ